MGFARGLTAIKQDVSCGPCLGGSHTSCEYLQLMEEINHNAHADEASSMVYFRPTCGCFIADEKRHYDYELDRGWVEAMEPEAKPEPEPRFKGEVNAWTTWEAHYMIPPRVLEELGFEAILDRISDIVYEGEGDLGPLKRWDDISLGGQFSRVITFDICKPESTQVEPEDFQKDVGLFLAGLGLEGHVLVHVSFNMMRPPQFDLDDLDDLDGGDED